MQFEKCLTCPAIKEQRCAGPNYMAMPTKELIEWGMAYQRINKITNAQLAERSGIPKGTIDGIKYRADIRHDTIYPLIRALIEMTGGTWGGDPCALGHADNSKHIENIKQLEAENRELKKDIAHAEEMIEEKEKRIQQYEKEYNDAQKDLKNVRKHGYILSLLCGVMGLFLVNYMNLDINNLHIGLIREAWVSPLIFVVVGVVIASIVVIAMQFVKKHGKDN